MKNTLLYNYCRHAARRVASPRQGGGVRYLGVPPTLTWPGGRYLGVTPILTWLEGRYLGRGEWGTILT